MRSLIPQIVCFPSLYARNGRLGMPGCSTTTSPWTPGAWRDRKDTQKVSWTSELTTMVGLAVNANTNGRTKPGGRTGVRGYRSSGTPSRAAVDVDHVARDPVGAGMGQRHDGAAEVVRRGQPVMRIPLRRDLDELLVAGDLAERRGVGDAAAQGVHGDSKRRELEGELARV